MVNYEGLRLTYAVDQLKGYIELARAGCPPFGSPTVSPRAKKALEHYELRCQLSVVLTLNLGYR